MKRETSERMLEDDGELTVEEEEFLEAVEVAEKSRGKPLGPRVDVRVAKNIRHVFSLKLSLDELEAIADASEALGVSAGAFLRDAAMDRVARLKESGGQEMTAEEISSRLEQMSKAVRRLQPKKTAPGKTAQPGLKPRQSSKAVAR